MDLEHELIERAKELDCLHRLTPLFTSYRGEERPLLRKVEIELMKAMTEPSKTRIELLICSAEEAAIEEPKPFNFFAFHRLNEEEFLILNLIFTDHDMVVISREKGLLESVLRLSAGAVQRLRNESEIKIKNAALGEMLSRLQEEREKDAKQLQIKLRTFILPLVKQIGSLLPQEQQKIILLKKELDELANSSNKNFQSLLRILTPRELEICGFIVDGMLSKEIADILNISSETVERHRCTIRQKLGLNKSKTNLKTYLTNL